MGASSCDFVGDRARGEAIEVSDKEVGQLTPTTEEGPPGPQMEPDRRPE